MLMLILMDNINLKLLKFGNDFETEYVEILKLMFLPLSYGILIYK